MKNLIILLINLDRSKDRLERTGSRLTELGFTWERLPALDGWAKKDEIAHYLDDATFHKQHGKPALPGEVGCYVSHINAMKQFLNTDHDYALILEDDIELGDDLPLVLTQTIKYSDRWDLVKFSGIHSGNPLNIIKLQKSPYFIAVTTTSYTGASCYLVNKKAATILAESLLPMRLPFDLAYDRGWETGLKIRMVNPAPCQHSFAMGSELHPKGIVRKNFHWSKRLGTYRWRIANDCKRFLYGLTEFVKEAMFKGR
jgi:glycosyl transferase family 25